MRPGIEKEEVLGMLTDMVYELEEADASLHHSLEAMRAGMYLGQTEKIEGFGIILDGIEANMAIKSKTPASIPDTKGLKLELGF